MPDELIEVFFSYSHKDGKLRDKLANQLKVFERMGVIRRWYDRQITAGSEWAGKINDHLNTSQIILLLISDDFLASDYCYDIEMRRAMERHDSGEARVIPVILRPCLWERTSLNKLQVLPTGARPVTDWPNRDKAFLNIAVGIEAAVKEITANASDLWPAPAVVRSFAPSHLPIWHIPHPRNPNFTGRGEELAQLSALLEAGKAAALVQAIHGLGGIGKTQLVVEYAYRHKADYNIVWWVRSEDFVTLTDDYAGLAAVLDLREKNETEQRIVVAAVKEWLQHNRGWLLIFDNAKDVESVRDYIPQSSAGRVIITSRNRNWASIAKPLLVNRLPLTEAVEFLLKGTAREDAETAERLAEALGCLPLALEQARAYIEASGCTMQHYLEVFEKNHSDIVHMMLISLDPIPYPATVVTTWNISFRNVKKENLAATELLRLCAFLAPDDIPINMMTAGAKDMPESLAAIMADPIQLDEALMALRKYSLVEVDDETLTVHRLVQALIRNAMNDEASRRWTKIAVHVLNASFPDYSDDARTWPICSLLLPHASVALAHAETINFESAETSRLLNQVGLYLYARAEYAQARQMHERALAISEEMFGPNHPSVAVRLNNLGLVLSSQGDLAGAKALYERAIAIGEATPDLNASELATWINNLGWILNVQGDLAGAKALHERALAVDEAMLGPDHPGVAVDLNNLGEVLRSQGDLDGAKAHLERALVILESALGPDHPDVGISLGNLGKILRAQGDLDGAKAHFERAIAILESALGPDHPDVAMGFNNFGDLLRDRGDLAGAKAFYKRALLILRESLGDGHHYTKTVLDNLKQLE